MTLRFPLTLLAGSLVLAMVAGAGAAADNKASMPQKPPVQAVEPYSPGLGDFMTAYVQPHHIKLWLAGSTGNWPLAAYEADELGETFDDVKTYQATWKKVPVAQLVAGLIEPPLKSVDAAIAAKDMTAFKAAYGRLTAACNACHRSARHEFLEIKVPTGDPFPDQDFGSH